MVGVKIFLVVIAIIGIGILIAIRFINKAIGAYETHQENLEHITRTPLKNRENL